MYELAVSSVRASDEDQVEEAPEAQAQEAQAEVGAQAQPMSSTSFMPQRITKSKAKALGDEHHWMYLFIISFSSFFSRTQKKGVDIDIGGVNVQR